MTVNLWMLGVGKRPSSEYRSPLAVEVYVLQLVVLPL